MSSKILRGGKAKLYIDGKLIETFDEVTWEPSSETKIHEIDGIKAVDYKTPHHICRNCRNEWTFSTDDNTCMNCKSKDIDHGDPKKHNR